MSTHQKKQQQKNEKWNLNIRNMASKKENVFVMKHVIEGPNHLYSTYIIEVRR